MHDTVEQLRFMKLSSCGHFQRTRRRTSWFRRSIQKSVIDSCLDLALLRPFGLGVHAATHAVAADYLSLYACEEQRDISLDRLDAALMQMRENSVNVLERYALITRRPAESALSLRRLVYAATRKQLQPQGQFRQQNEPAVTQLL